jgi:hypothetical protein
MPVNAMMANVENTESTMAILINNKIGLNWKDEN